MFVTVSIYRAKAGEEDAIIALHEDWQRNQQAKVQGYISGELLRNIQSPREFIAIMRFESQEAAQVALNNREQVTWQRRLVSLTESMSVPIDCNSEWQSVGRVHL